MSQLFKGKNSFQFQLGLSIFLLMGLTFGLILTTGKASLVFSPMAQVVTNYNLNCNGATSACIGNVYYKCVGGTLVKSEDCNTIGFTCVPDWGNYVLGCSSPPGLHYTYCYDSVIYQFDAGIGDVVKYVCQNGCNDSGFQKTGDFGADASCIKSSYKTTHCNADNTKVLYCDGTYCTTVKRDCSAVGLKCHPYRTGAICD